MNCKMSLRRPRSRGPAWKWDSRKRRRMPLPPPSAMPRGCRTITSRPSISCSPHRYLEGKRLASFGLTKDAILTALKSVRGSQRVTSADPESTYQSLEKYGRDLTDMARKGKLDPVIGRDEEIRRVVQILSRRSKNNPALIGDPGVGKTAIVEGLAQRIINGDVPEGLKKKRLFSWI